MTLNVSVREDILTSWQRCVVAGLRPDRFEVPYQPDFDDDGPLLTPMAEGASNAGVARRSSSPRARSRNASAAS
jgi:hypothetical protein